MPVCHFTRNPGGQRLRSVKRRGISIADVFPAQVLQRLALALLRSRCRTGERIPVHIRNCHHRLSVVRTPLIHASSHHLAPTPTPIPGLLPSPRSAGRFQAPRVPLLLLHPKRVQTPQDSSNLLHCVACACMYVCYCMYVCEGV